MEHEKRQAAKSGKRERQFERPDVSSRFRVLEELGRGGMAVVYRVHDRRTNAEHALKIGLPSEHPDRSIASFRREIGLARRVRHPRVPRVREAGVWRGRPWFIMPPIQGFSLRDLAGRGRGLSTGVVLDLAIQACDVLAAVHEAGVLHRDVKTGNFLVSDFGSVYLVDFGIAADLRDLAALAEGDLEGSPLYIPPERYRAQEEDLRSDIFGLGVTLFEMLTGRLPIVGDTLATICARVLSQPPQPVSALDPSVSPELDSLVARMMAKSPSGRPASVNRVRWELEAILDNLPGGAEDRVA